MAVRSNIDRLLERLYAVTETESFYPNLTRILRDAFTIAGYEILLLNKDGEYFKDWSALDDEKESQEFALEVQGQTIGKIRISPPFTRQVPLFDSFLKHIALATFSHKNDEQQERLVEEAVSQVQALESLSHLLNELDPELILNRVLKFCMDIAGAEVGGGRYLVGGEVQLKVSWGMPEQIMAGLEVPLDPHAGVQVLPLESFRRGPFTLGGILGLPLNLTGDRSAELFLASGEQLGVDPIALQVLESSLLFGQQALQKALDHDDEVRRQRLDEQMQVAQGIQARLLPQELPSTPNLEMAGLNRSAQIVGGDYYDVLTLKNGDIMALVADVAGKGVPAALRMSGLRALLHAQRGSIGSPAELLTRINRFLCEEEDMSGSFITACCLYFKQDGQEVTLSSAGHEPAMIHREDGAVETLDVEGGLPLGLRLDEEYVEKSLQLDRGDLIFLYSDGAVDAKSEELDRYGHERLQESLSQKKDSSADELLKSVLEDLESFRGKQPWADDLTLLVIKRAGER